MYFAINVEFWISIRALNNLDNDEVKDEKSQSDEGDDALAVCQGQVDVGAEPHLVVHPGDDHHVAREAEQDHADVGTDDKNR